MIARIVIDTALDRVFDYAVPPGLTHASVGARVRVPFGRREATGYIIELAEQSAWVQRPVSGPAGPAELPGLAGRDPDPPSRLRPILAVEGDHPFLLPGLIRLARWIAAYYCAPLELCIRGLMPAPVREGRSRSRELLFVAPAEPLPPAASWTPRQAELLANIRRVQGGWLHALCTEFSCSPGTLHKLAEAGGVTIEKRVQRRDPLANRRVMPTRPLALMPEQAAALETVRQALAAASDAPPKPLLLYGVTGSGKTEVYLQAIATVLDQGRGAIVLVPEIALTPQTVQRFAGRFGETVAVLHSALSDGERHDEWHRIRKGEARVVIGPRSAVFAPVHPLGLIVVDEEHEPSYKQDEAPRYHGRDVAVMRGHIEGCAVLLGTATPSLETWNNVSRGKYGMARLPRRADHCAMPLVQVVDMRIETARTGHAQVFSQVLIDAIQDRLGRGEQVLLFMNRRGFATSLVCPSCGHVAVCEACDIAFTYHRADSCLRCHVCGGWQHVPATCPGCRDPAFRYAGFGTQRIEDIVRRCFPSAAVGRMDADITSRKHSHEDILGAFRTGRTDILIGTQMIAKGLHFPNVTLVGIVMADSSLHLPDFRAGERTFQLLAQVAGRAGRGATPGEVVVQTYTPDHPAVLAARTEDFGAFAEGELPARREGGYPPFTHLICLTFRAASEACTRLAADAFGTRLAALADAATQVSPATPAPLAKARGQFRYQVLLRSPVVAPMTRILRQALTEVTVPKEVSLAIDVDAVSIL